MVGQRDMLAPVKSQIDQLLKREEALRKIAHTYTDAEAQHVFWFDLLSEVRGAFASDAVWLIDLEPLSGYDPLAETAGKDAKKDNGKSVIKPDFATASYGTSSMLELPPEKVDTKGAKGKPAAAAPAGPTANAVRIKGFWRPEAVSQNVVSDLLKNLREKSENFRFTAKDAKGKEITLNDSTILNITLPNSGDAGLLGLPFEITLPLVREIPVR
jgi:hypothetical protein